MHPKTGDVFRVRATTIVILFLFSICAHAEIDFTLGANVRSYPLSGVVEVDSGYDLLLWGSVAPGNPWYGYSRISVTADSAATYNSLAAGFEFFPLSFIGGKVGGESVQNDSTYSAYDCGTYDCRGRFYRTYIQAQITLGAGPVFVRGRWRRNRWSMNQHGTKNFIDPTDGLAMAAWGDSETEYLGMLGIKLDEEWSTVAIFNAAEAANVRGFSRFPLLLVRYTSGRFSAGVGAGAFDSSLKSQSATGVVLVEWNPLPSFALQ